ncbi:MAG TPA: hypothetical protein VMV46_04860 [Thermoanaerobaculia bacterium]|nr:hypothetical protein [Thermoanaerobaculia bacterium]
MSKRTLAVSAFALIAILLAPPALPAQEPPPLAAVYTVHTHLGHAAEYEAGLAGLWKAFAKAGVDKPVFVSSSLSEPGDYTFVIGHSSWADLDAWDQKTGAAMASAADAMASLQKMTRSDDWSLWRSRPNLSYVPENPRVTEAEEGFTRVVFLRPHPEHAGAFEELMKEVVALRKKHALTDAAYAWQLWAGADGPAFAVLIPAKDEADFYTHQAQAMAKMGADWQALSAKAGSMLREISYGANRPRPDLAFTP